MRYEKPRVVPTGSRAMALGDELMSCISGNGATACSAGPTPSGAGVCGVGTSPTVDSGCTAGPAAGDCAGGSGASITCLSGAIPFLGEECAVGTSGAPGACTVGPSA